MNIIKDELKDLKRLYPDVDTSDLQGLAGAKAMNIIKSAGIPFKNFQEQPIEDLMLQYVYGDLGMNEAYRFILDEIEILKKQQ